MNDSGFKKLKKPHWHIFKRAKSESGSYYEINEEFVINGVKQGLARYFRRNRHDPTDENNYVVIGYYKDDRPVGEWVTQYVGDYPTEHTNHHGL